MRRSGVWILSLAILVGGGGALVLLGLDEGIELLEGEARVASAAGAGPGLEPGAETGSLSAKSAAEQEAERAREEAAAKAASAPTFTRAEGVFGRVIDPRDAGIAGAKVTLFVLDPTVPWGAPDGPPAATATSAADGTFLVGPAPDGRRLKLRADATGYASTTTWVPSRGARVDLVLDRGGAVRVVVRDDAKGVVKGAEVRSTNTGVSVATGEDGSALLEALPVGPVAVRVQMAGYAGLNLNDVVIEAGKTIERTCVLSRGATIEGRVVDEAGAGVVGAEVVTKAQWDASAVSAVPVTSGEDGRFALEASSGGGEWIQVVATKQGFAPGIVGVMLQPGAQGQNVLVKLQADGGVAGRVEDAQGQPVAGATVVFAQQFRAPGKLDAAATSAADGSFTLPLPHSAEQEGQQFFLAARAPGKGAGGAMTEPSKRGGAPPPPVVIRLSGSGAVVGTVKNAAGDPLEGANVSLNMDWNERSVQLATGAVRQDDWMVKQAVMDQRLTQLSASTDATGAFRVADVPAGTFQVAVTWGLDRDAATEPVTVRAGGEESVQLTIGAGGTIEGFVRDADGNGVAGVNVQGNDPAHRGNSPRWSNTRSESDGRFVLRGVRGEAPWRITVSAQGYRRETVQNVRPGTKDVDVRLTVLGWVEGIVTLDDVPYGKTFTVSAQGAGQGPRQSIAYVDMPMGGMVRRGGGSTQMFTSADGRFVLRGLAAATYALNVTTRDGLIPLNAPEVSVVDGRGAGPVEIRLTRGAGLTGTLLDEATREPVEQAWIGVSVRGQATTAGTTSANTQTDARGRFVVQGLASGAYLLQVTPPKGVMFDDDVVLERGRVEEKTLVAPRGGALLVRVVDGDGQPVANATVSLTTERGTPLHPNWDAIRREGRVDLSLPDAWQRITQTDAAGTCLRTLLPPGRVQVQVHPPASSSPGPMPAPAPPPGGFGGPGAAAPTPAASWASIAADKTTEVAVTVERPKDAPR
jgi:hypothetical protein